MKKHIPNFITLLNLVSGVLGILALLDGKFEAAVYLVFLAGVFDFSDGFAARILKAYSDIGKSLDSLADIVSFGVLPAIIAFVTLSNNSFPGEALNNIIPYTALIIPAFSAVRLAIFNNDPGQEKTFRGLPTPANAFLVASASFFYMKTPDTSVTHTALLIVVIIAGCNLMISGLNMFSLKINASDKPGLIRNVIYLLLSLTLILIFGMGGIFLAIVLYVLLSVVYSFLKH